MDECGLYTKVWMYEKYVKMACYVEGKDDDQTAKQIDEEWVVG